MNSAKESKQGQTTEQIEHLDKCIIVLSESVGHLTDRLSMALRNQPSVTDKDKSEKPPEDELVPMANSIRQLKCRVANINNNVQDILGRIEL